MAPLPLLTFILAIVAAAPMGSARAADIPQDQRVSGYQQMAPATQALQDDEIANPALLWLLDGEALWRQQAGRSERACADCHQHPAVSMKGVATRYPMRDRRRGVTLNLEARINLCRTEQQSAPALTYETKELLSLTIFVAHQSKGMPISVAGSSIEDDIESGRTMFNMRQGQLNLSCAHCHNDNWGRKLAGNTIPQGHPTGYPQYRLEWQSVGSLHRRLRNCLTGMRAESFPAGSPELVALEAYLMHRARDMAVEGLAVRP